MLLLTLSSHRHLRLICHMAAESATSLAQYPAAESSGGSLPARVPARLLTCYIRRAGQHTVLVPHRCQPLPHCIDSADAHSCPSRLLLDAANQCPAQGVMLPPSATAQPHVALSPAGFRHRQCTQINRCSSCRSGLPLITSRVPAGARPRQRTYQELVQQYKDRLGSIGGPVSAEELQAFMGHRRRGPAGVQQSTSAQERQPMRLRRWSTGGPPPR